MSCPSEGQRMPPRVPNALKEHLQWAVFWFPAFWCTLHLVEVSFSLSWHKPKLGSQFILSSPSPYLPLVLPHKAIMKTKLIISFKTWTESFGVVGERGSKPQMAQGTFLSWACRSPSTGTNVPSLFHPAQGRTPASSPAPRSPLPWACRPCRRQLSRPHTPALAVCCAASFCSLQAGQIRAVCSSLNPPWLQARGFPWQRIHSVLRTEGSCGCTVSPSFPCTDPLRHPSAAFAGRLLCIRYHFRSWE